MDYEFNFLSATNAQYCAFLTDPFITKLMANNPGVSTNHFKQEIYNKFYNLAPRKKMTGFENVKALDLKARAILQHTESSGRICVKEQSVNFFENTGIDYATASRQYACKIEMKAKSLNKKLVLFYSGGVDSEFMCNIFRDAGVEFEIVFVDYNGLNSYDKSFADKYISEYKAHTIIKKFDVEEFMTDVDLLKGMSAKYNKTSPQILAYHRMIELVSSKHNAFCVLAGELRAVYASNSMQGYINWQKGMESDPGCPGGQQFHAVNFPDCFEVFIE